MLKPDAVIKRMSYRVPEQLQVSLRKVVNLIDLSKGYWQIPLPQELTAFRTPWGPFHFKVLSFGLHRAPASFQRLMDQVLQGITFTTAYLDDIVIYNDTWEQHLKHIQEVLKCLQRTGLTVNPQKCAVQD